MCCPRRRFVGTRRNRLPPCVLARLDALALAVQGKHTAAAVRYHNPSCHDQRIALAVQPELPLPENLAAVRIDRGCQVRLPRWILGHDKKRLAALVHLSSVQGRTQRQGSGPERQHLLAEEVEVHALQLPIRQHPEVILDCRNHERSAGRRLGGLLLLAKRREDRPVFVAHLVDAEKPKHAGVGHKGELLAVVIGLEPRPAADARLGLKYRLRVGTFDRQAVDAQLHVTEAVGLTDDEVRRP